MAQHQNSRVPQQFTREQQADFLDALADWGNVRSAARACGVSRTTAYRMRRACPRFRQLWDAALLLARPKVEEVLADRALNGVEEVVYYHGEEVAVRRRYDGRLLLAHLGRLDRIEEDAGAARASGSFFAELEALEGEPEIEFDSEGPGEGPETGEGDMGGIGSERVSPLDSVPGVSGEPELRRTERETHDRTAEGRRRDGDAVGRTTRPQAAKR